MKSIMEKVEMIHRRLVRAKEIVKAGDIVKVSDTGKPLYVCLSQRKPKQLYVVRGFMCSCDDHFRFAGRKLCKHMLARMIFEGALDSKKINANPFYFRRVQKEQNHAA